MEGLKNLLIFLNENWATIVCIAGLTIALYMKIMKAIKDWKAMTDDEKKAELERQIEKAKEAIAQYILSYVSQAEIDWAYEGKFGEIKRAEVIGKVFEAYPVLTMVTDQEELIGYIDALIEKALETVRTTIRLESK